jgi:methylated-DNA-protein-cysteine methyltransferase-like protein
MHLNRTEIIWQVVAAIPAGTVASYGQIAALAGYPGCARQVGFALKNLPEDTALPWHRVVNAQGRLAFAGGSAAWCRQRALLEAEGVVFTQQKIALRVYGWRPQGGPSAAPE